MPIDQEPNFPDWRYTDSLYYGDLMYFNAIGLTAGGTFEWAIRLTPTELGPHVGTKLVAMKFWHHTGDLNNQIKIYGNGTPTSPGALLHSEPYTSTGSPQTWVFVPFSDSLDITASGDLWVSVEGTHVAGTHPAGCDAGPAVDGKGDWIYAGTWDELQNYGFDYNWLIVAFVDAGPVDHDVGVASYDSPVQVPENTTYDPLVTVQNYGINTETFDVTCQINPGAYSSTRTVTSLAPGNTEQVTFDGFAFASGTYNVVVYTQLGGDENLSNDTLTTSVTASDWLFWDDGAPSSAWAWNDSLWGWGVQFVAPEDVWVDSIAAFLYDASWPNPGSDLSTFRIYDGASQPTNVRQAWINQTISRGTWNKFGTDTTLNYFASGENIFFFWFQPDTFPFTPGLSCDAMIDHNSFQWWYNEPGSWGTGALSGDWLLRVHVISVTGIAEWIDYTPQGLSMSVPGINRGDVAIQFTLPHTSQTELVLYDATGRKMETLVSSTLAAGTHRYTTTVDLAAGVYFITLATENGSITKKSLIVK